MSLRKMMMILPFQRFKHTLIRPAVTPSVSASAPYTSMSASFFHASSKLFFPLLGPKDKKKVHALDVIALLIEDERLSPSKEGMKELLAHMVGAEEQKDDLSHELSRKINMQRPFYLISLALRFPELLAVAQQLEKIKYNAIIQPRSQPSTYIRDLEVVFNLHVADKTLKAGEIIPGGNHDAMLALRKELAEKFGEVEVGPYSEEELEHIRAIRKKFIGDGRNTKEHLMSFDMAGYVEKNLSSISADVEPVALTRATL